MENQYSFIIESLNAQASGGHSVERGRDYGRQIAAARARGDTAEAARLVGEARTTGQRLTGQRTRNGEYRPQGRQQRAAAVAGQVNAASREAAGLPPRSGTQQNPPNNPQRPNPQQQSTPRNANPGYFAGMKNKVGTYGGAMAVGAGLGALINGINGWRKGKGFFRSAMKGAMTGMGVGMAGRFIGNRLSPNNPTPHGTT